MCLACAFVCSSRSRAISPVYPHRHRPQPSTMLCHFHFRARAWHADRRFRFVRPLPSVRSCPLACVYTSWIYPHARHAHAIHPSCATASRHRLRPTRPPSHVAARHHPPRRPLSPLLPFIYVLLARGCPRSPPVCLLLVLRLSPLGLGLRTRHRHP